MRLHEIEEALPGNSPLRKLAARAAKFGKAYSDSKAMREKAKQAYQSWVKVVVPKAIDDGKRMNDPTEYANYFGLWMARNLKLNASDDIIQRGAKELAATPKITPQTIEMLILRMMEQQRAAASEPVKSKPAKTAEPSIPLGKIVPYGGVDYEWDGTVWRNKKTRAEANASQTKVLNDFAKRNMP